MLSLFNFSANYATENSTDDLVKTGAYKALLRSGITSLPINYKDVIQSLQYSITRIWTYSYQRLEKEVRESVEDFGKECGDYGAIFCMKPNSYIIYYNDIWPDDVKNLVFLSLYAHAELNLVPVNGLARYTDNLNKMVEDFVYYFLAPDPVLKECGIYNAKDIAETCHIPLKNALEKSHQLKHNRRNRETLFDISLKHNFNDYIKGIENAK